MFIFYNFSFSNWALYILSSFSFFFLSWAKAAFSLYSAFTFSSSLSASLANPLSIFKAFGFALGGFLDFWSAIGTSFGAFEETVLVTTLAEDFLTEAVRLADAGLALFLATDFLEGASET